MFRALLPKTFQPWHRTGHAVVGWGTLNAGPASALHPLCLQKATNLAWEAGNGGTDRSLEGADHTVAHWNLSLPPPKAGGHTMSDGPSWLQDRSYFCVSIRGPVQDPGQFWQVGRFGTRTTCTRKLYTLLQPCWP